VNQLDPVKHLSHTFCSVRSFLAPALDLVPAATDPVLLLTWETVKSFPPMRLWNWIEPVSVQTYVSRSRTLVGWICQGSADSSPSQLQPSTHQLLCRQRAPRQRLATPRFPRAPYEGRRDGWGSRIVGRPLVELL